ncbi:MAG: phosphoglycerate kinase [Saprospiraceae bacterium]
MMNMRSCKVILRVDFNVPINSEGVITDDTRIVKALPTVQQLLAQGAKLIVMSHLGRPLKDLNEDGSIKMSKYSLRPVASRLSELISQPVAFASDCGGPDSMEKIDNLKDGELVLLENTRFRKEEEKGDSEWARSLSALGEFYINDAFGAAHREHATTATIARYFDHDHKGFGLLMDAEVSNASRVLDHPHRPLTAIVGGAKVSDKIALLENLIGRCDHIIIGGGMAYTFLAAQGFGIGKSLCEQDKIGLASEILVKAQERNCRIHLPIDSVCGDRFAPDASVMTTEGPEVKGEWMALDIGPRTVQQFAEVVRRSKTIVWNGPMGVFEMPAFSNGTKCIAQAVAEATTSENAFTLIGGGDSVAAINQFGLADKVSFVSTGGGAMLELLEGKTLPGIAAIKE